MIGRHGTWFAALALAATSACAGCSSTRSEPDGDASARPSDAASDVVATPPIDGRDGFDCGGTVTCDAASQVCEHVGGGAPPGVSFYSCVALPTACSGDRSCACVTAALQSRGAGGCSAPDGHITVQINVP